MTPAALRATLAQLGWTRGHMAGLLGCSSSLVDRWCSGELALSEPLAAWLELCVKRQPPPPEHWKTKRGRPKKNVPTGAELS
jgi:hypothetical protein